MKKSLYIVFFVIALCGDFYAQFSSTGYNSDEFKKFELAKSIDVVLTGDANYDEAIKSAISSNWSLKPTNFITSEQFEESIKDETKSFLLLCKIEYRPSQSYHFLTILNGGKKKLSKYGYGDLIAYCPLNFFGDENKLTNCAYRLPILIHQLESTVKLIKDEKLSGGSFDLGEKLSQIYNKKSNIISKQNKVLLINSELGNIKLDNNDISEVYKNRFEICSKSKIEEVIKTKNSNYVILQPGITLNKFIFVFDASNYDCIYANIDIMGLKVKSSDFKQIMKYTN